METFHLLRTSLLSQLPPQPSPEGEPSPAAEPKHHQTLTSPPPQTTWVAQGAASTPSITQRLVPPLGTLKIVAVTLRLPGLSKHIPLPAPPRHRGMLSAAPRFLPPDGRKPDSPPGAAAPSAPSFSNNDLRQTINIPALFPRPKALLLVPPAARPFQICSCFSSICEGAQDRSSLNTFPYACGATAYSGQISPFRNEGEFNSVLE